MPLPDFYKLFCSFCFLVCTADKGRCVSGSTKGYGQCTPSRKWCYCTDCTSGSDTALAVFTLGFWELRNDYSFCKCRFRQ